jgi:putative PIN family toxin of toxin-antitoxin system
MRPASRERVYRAVLDPGVLIAALLSPSGAPAELLRRWRAGDYELVASPQLLAELERVLLRPKFRQYCTTEEAQAYVAWLRHFATLTQDPPLEAGLTPDPSDDYLVSLARFAQADFLVSGDPHLTELPSPQPPVLNPRAFLDRL